MAKEQTTSAAAGNAIAKKVSDVAKKADTALKKIEAVEGIVAGLVAPDSKAGKAVAVAGHTISRIERLEELAATLWRAVHGDSTPLPGELERHAELAAAARD